MVLVEQHHKHYFDPEPGLPNVRLPIRHNQPETKDRCSYRGGGHDSTIESLLHYLESFNALFVRTHGVIHKQPGKVEEPGEPGNNGNQMQGEHVSQFLSPTLAKVCVVDGRQTVKQIRTDLDRFTLDDFLSVLHL